MKEQDDVAQFMRTVGQSTRGWPTVLEGQERDLRVELIREEFQELVMASGMNAIVKLEPFTVASKPNLPETADALADLLYVLLGWAVAAGIDLGAVFALVHAANMAKVSGPVRGDGKRLKPEGWTPPDVDAELRRQKWRGV